MMSSDNPSQKSAVKLDDSSFQGLLETSFMAANNGWSETALVPTLPVLNAEQLEAIARETRALFLEEEASEYLATLEQGIKKLQAASEGSASQECAILIRTAHSFKGGASLAQLPILSQLAHKLEDLLVALQQGRHHDKTMVCELLGCCLEQMRDRLDLVTLSASSIEPEVLPIIAEIDNFLLTGDRGLGRGGEGEQGSRGAGEQGSRGAEEQRRRGKNYQLPITHSPLPITQSLIPNPQSPVPSPQSPKSDFVKTALLVDLEECLQRLELQILRPQPSEKKEKEIIESSELNDRHELQSAIATWVEECTLLGQALSLTWLIDTVELIRQASSRRVPAIEQIATTAIAHIREMRSQFLEEKPEYNEPKKPDKKLKNFPISNSQSPIPNPQSPTDDSLGHKKNKKASKIPEQFLKYILVNSEPPPEMPSFNLRVSVDRLDRMGNAVGELSIDCERLALYREQLSQASQNLKKCTPAIGGIREPNNSYIRELMVQVQESRSDMDLIARELQETLDRMRSYLDLLHEDLRASRLVPFALLSDRFLALLQALKGKYRKSVDLIVEGKDTLIDRAVLEQLQMPLTHLFNNAFDHGIELPVERRECQKPPTAKIVLSATTSGNNILIAIADDGRGIDPQKVYQRAVEMGLIDDRNSQFSSEILASNQGEILEYLFAPGFSTTTTVSEISGRGVGLDIVRHQIARLRGSLQVETTPGQGTKFTISIPLTLNILSLLLCRCGQRTLAIPSTSIQEIISISEFPLSGKEFIDWQGRSVPLFALMDLLPYGSGEMLSSSTVLTPNLGIVLKINEEPVVVAVDALLGERELVLKLFDSTVSVPDYVAGCTVLGTGEVVPVLSPNQLGELIGRQKKGEGRKERGDNSLNAQFAGFRASTRSILIVDDSIAVRRSLELLLSQSGYQVMPCRDGKEALEELLRSGGGFDLVISDIEMPRLDGLALLKAIRSNASTWHLPVAMLTARDSDPLRQQAMSLGATAYFIKPFTPNLLLDAIATLLAA